MPRHGKNPPHKRAQNGLAYRKRDDVAFSREKPAHRRATDKSQRNEYRIWPVQPGKNGAGEQRAEARGLECIEKPVRQIGIQCNLLQEAECEVSEEAPGFSDARWHTVESAEPEACCANSKNQYRENDQSLA